MSAYMKVLVISAVFPFILSFFPPLRFYKHIRALLATFTLILVIFGTWDVFATLRGHWSFNPDYVWGFKLVNLPIEEALFFIFIPFACIFTWEAILYIKGKF